MRYHQFQTDRSPFRNLFQIQPLMQLARGAHELVRVSAASVPRAAGGKGTLPAPSLAICEIITDYAIFVKSIMK